MNPGFLSSSDARTAADFLRQVEANRRALERRPRHRRDHFPAKLTSTDGQGRFGWTKQGFDAAGRRVDDTSGVRGTPAYMPAYAIGDGTGPLPSTLPVETWLRRVLVTSERGPVFEFDWQCACVGGYSGSGSGAASNLAPALPCCDNLRLPRTLFITFVRQSGTCACLDGLTLTIQFDDANSWWAGSTVTSCPSGQTFAIRVSCELVGGVYFWILRPGTGNQCLFNFGTPPPQGVPTASCPDPVTITFGNNITFIGANCCTTVSVFSATVTE